MNQAKKIAARTVITSHSNADFDALAAMIAASKLYPESVLVFPGSQEKNLRNFFIQSTTYLFNFKESKDIDPEGVELLVVVDTRQRSRLSHVQKILDKKDVVIHVYDHHPDSDEDLAAAKSVVKPWGSCTAILVKEMRKQGLHPHSEEATILGLGIFEDTGSFGFDSTTEHDFEAAAWLRRHGMELGVISDLLSRDLSAEQITILGDLLDSAKTHDIHGTEVVIAEATTEHFVGDFAFLVHKLMDMENIRVLFTLGRMGDRVHLVARSKNPNVNVGQICSYFGGGGHAYAASATIKDKTPAEIRDELFAILYSHIKPQLHVEALVSKPPLVIEEHRPMKDAVELMTRFGLKSVPVVGKGGMSCVGILQHKIADKAMSHGLGEVQVSEYMQRKYSSVASDADLYGVMEIILGKRQRLVPVVDKGLITGVITRTDLVNLMVEEPSRIPEALFPERKQDRNIRSVMRNRLPQEVYDLLTTAGELAQELGYVAFAVGGFVRDILLDRVNFDLDLVIEGDGIAFARAMAKKLGGRFKSHKKFKTAVVILPNDQRVDVATARLEYYEYPAALPTVELSSIKMDLYRRDFTINALAVNVNPNVFGNLVDFFGAQRDIKDKVVRVLHSLSFVEDPTRILRAIRFEARFNFHIGPQTLRLIKNAVQLSFFNRLSGSRIFHEFQLITEEENPLPCFTRMEELKLLEAIHPLLKLTAERLRVLDELAKVRGWYRLLYLEPKAAPWKLYLLGLTMNAPQDKVPQICARLNFSKREEREFLALREQIGEALGRLMTWSEGKDKLSELCRILEQLPVEGVLFMLARSKRENMRKHISQYLSRLRYISTDVKGGDLKSLGLSPGPDFARILRQIKAAKIDGLAETRQDQLDMAQRLAASMSPRPKKARPRRGK
ncbi:MAG: CBS domain-containing protein [Desulfovibrionaceae bacterium]|nr:CBS domain-containing protein [Desulfovibrionaceae bacterium]